MKDVIAIKTRNVVEVSCSHIKTSGKLNALVIISRKLEQKLHKFLL